MKKPRRKVQIKFRTKPIELQTLDSIGNSANSIFHDYDRAFLNTLIASQESLDIKLRKRRARKR